MSTLDDHEPQEHSAVDTGSEVVGELTGEAPGQGRVPGDDRAAVAGGWVALTTGRVDVVPVPCGSRWEDRCPPCAQKARRMRTCSAARAGGR
jgi:hypothetical protein